MTYICSAPSKYLNVIHCTLYIAKIIAQNKVYMDCTKEIFYCHPLSTENIALAPGIRGFFHKYLSAERLLSCSLRFALSDAYSPFWNSSWNMSLKYCVLGSNDFSFSSVCFNSFTIALYPIVSSNSTFHSRSSSLSVGLVLFHVYIGDGGIVIKLIILKNSIIGFEILIRIIITTCWHGTHRGMIFIITKETHDSFRVFIAWMNLKSSSCMLIGCCVASSVSSYALTTLLVMTCWDSLVHI